MMKYTQCNLYVNHEFIKNSTADGIQWTPFMDEELRRCNKGGRGVAKLHLLQKKKRLPHHFFMGAELARIGENKERTFMALLDARAYYLSIEKDRWSMPVLFAKPHCISAAVFDAAKQQQAERAVWIDKPLAPDGNNYVVMPPSGGSMADEATSFFFGTKPRREIVVTACDDANITTAVRHYVRFVSDDIDNLFFKKPTPVRRLVLGHDIVCTLIEEAKTDTEWMFNFRTSRVTRTDCLCKALIGAMKSENLCGTFFIDDAHYAKRHAFTRKQHFRFFCMQKLEQAASNA